jgi:hypothetical protein
VVRLRGIPYTDTYHNVFLRDIVAPLEKHNKLTRTINPEGLPRDAGVVLTAGLASLRLKQKEEENSGNHRTC